ncbi:sigma-54-dependent Fis family transcriptional regulator [Neomegalonema sp.]|uniref:sigma-54-dependent Fis family transcriptional regulator n=1 Tax=Neomegalonema sp. TaxID=2039713 RepID=UPI00260D1F09|nr:sigma-54-dependent Fis family transcriptional regulator [Neomegalonema sp.]MDD2867444.1 sigma-54-dependent Fis family transcriptional regulator [Neomegalonema sp.]
MTSPLAHIKEIERVALGALSRRDAPVVESWLRCLNDYKLDPAAAQEAYIVPEAILREHREQAEDLIRIGRSGLESLFRQVAGQSYVLLLSDARGVAVEFMGDPTFDNHLRKAGLYLGSEWSENRAGTCAVGACMVSGEPVIIHQDDHFDLSHIGLTCTAAPIFDTLGDLTAVLDISQLRSPAAKTSQQLALHLVASTARRIELANLMARTREDWVLRLARSPEFLDVDPEAALTLDGEGRITGMTHGGFRALLKAMNLEDFGARRFIGEPVSRFFDLETADLPLYLRGRPEGRRILRAHDGFVLFARSIAPVSASPRRAEAPAAPAPPSLPRALRELSFGDPEMDRLQARAARLAGRGVPILIQGETGSGKEHLARAIHASSRLPGRFVAVNCAALPEHLIESELFGYAPGAFTGAHPKGKRGLILEADGGTLFLDEIGDMPLTLQGRLLRVLSENEVQPVGALEARPVRLQWLSASHRDLEELAAEGRFRVDLHYRLNAATLRLPPLRARRDLEPLMRAILKRLGEAEGGGVVHRLEPEARLALLRHAWPGNLRELTNVLRVGAALSEDGVITLDHLPERLAAAASPQAPEEAGILQALKACGGNVSALAREMGVDRSTIHRRLKRLQG